MNNVPPQGIDPPYPSYPESSEVRRENRVKHGKNRTKGHGGHKGHVRWGGVLLSGLFGADHGLTPVTTPADPPDDNADSPLSESTLCQFCGSANLIDSDDPPGIRCDGCGRLAWIDDGQSLIKVGWHDPYLASMAPDDLPTCDRCGDLCDTQTLDDRWHCSHCFPAESAIRRARSRQLMSRSAEMKARSRKEHGQGLEA